MNTCSSCKYFKDGGEKSWNVCRKFPTSIFVNTDYWCGEWKRKDMFSNHPEPPTPPSPNRPEKYSPECPLFSFKEYRKGWNDCCDAWEEYLKENLIDSNGLNDPTLGWFNGIAYDCKWRTPKKEADSIISKCYHGDGPVNCNEACCPLIAHENRK